MAGIGNDGQLGLLPHLVKVPGIRQRRCDIVAAMHDGAWNAFELSGLRQELIVGPKEAAMLEIVALDAGEGERKPVLAELRNPSRIGQERDGARLPLAPGPCA